MDGRPAGRHRLVDVPKRTTVRLAVAFGHHTDPSTPYVYHCHILRHEDEGTTGHFVIAAPGAERRRAAATFDGRPSPRWLSLVYFSMA